MLSRRIVALALVVTTTLVTMPLSAADFTTKRSPLGSVSAVGPVELRGIGMSQEGTLFAGDSIKAGQKGYAKVLLGTGSKIELAEKTDVSVNRDAQGVKIAMNTGTIGFTAHNPLRIDVAPFEVVATDDASGNVAIMGGNAAGVRAINGKVTVRNLQTSESFVVLKGQERLLGLKNGIHAPALGQIASNVPGPIPAPVPQTPAGKTTGGFAMDTGGWLAVIGGAALAGVAIWGLVVAMDTRDDIDDLKSTIDSQNGRLTSQAASIKAISNAAAIANAAAQLQAQQAAVAALAAQANAALRVSGNATAAAAAQNLANQSASLSQQLNALQGQIQAAQAAIAAGTGSQSTLTTLLQQEETIRNAANTVAQQLNTLLQQNSNTPGVPNTSVGTVGGPVLASASLPV